MLYLGDFCTYQMFILLKIGYVLNSVKIFVAEWGGLAVTEVSLVNLQSPREGHL